MIPRVAQQIGVAALLCLLAGARAAAQSAEPARRIAPSDPAAVGETPAVIATDVRALAGRQFERSGLLRELGLLGDRLVAEGYLSAEITARLVGVNGAGADSVAIQVHAGDPARWLGLATRISGDRGEAAIPPAPPVPGRGERFAAALFERWIWRWVDAAAEAGYPFAVATVESLRVGPAGVLAGVRLDPGRSEPIVEVGLRGGGRVDHRFVRRWLRVEPTERFSARRAEERARLLERTGLFQSVGGAELARFPEGGLRILYPVREAAFNRIEGAIGYSGASRALTGMAALELGNLAGKGRRVGVRWSRPRDADTRFDLSYRDLLLPRVPFGATLILEQEVRDSTLSHLRWEAGLDLPLSWDWTVSLGVEGRRTALGVEPAEQRRRLSSVFGARWDARSEASWRGGRGEFAFRTGRERIRLPDGRRAPSVRLTRADLEAEALILGRSLLSGRVRGRFGAVTGADSLVSSEVYRLGGAAELRGHPEEAYAARRYGLGQLELGRRLAGDAGGWTYLFVDGARLLGPNPGATPVWEWGFGVGLQPRSGPRAATIDLGLPGTLRLEDLRVHLRLETRF